MLGNPGPSVAPNNAAKAGQFRGWGPHRRDGKAVTMPGTSQISPLATIIRQQKGSVTRATQPISPGHALQPPRDQHRSRHRARLVH